MNVFKTNLALFFLLFPVLLFAQERMSIHYYDELRYGIKNEEMSDAFAKKVELVPLNREANSLKKDVFGYLPDWEYVSGAQKYFRYELLSHIACFDFQVSASGNISAPARWPWTDVINNGHTKGVKIILTLVNFDKDDIRKILTDATVQRKTIQNVLTYMQSYKLDGVNVDFEGLYSADKGSRINNFLKALTDSVHAHFPEGEVSFAAPSVNWGGYWDFSALANSCDYLFIMGYDFFGKFSSYSGPTAPLTGGTYNITNTVLTQYKDVTDNHPEKLILGVPYFGEYYITESSAENSRIVQFVSSPRFRSAQVQSMVYGRLWSSKYQTPWYRWNDGHWNQVWYDDDQSLGLKYDLADSKNLRGVGMWALGYDGDRQELWNLIDMRYGSGVIPAPATPTDFRVLADTDSTLRLQFEIPSRATSFIVYMSKDGVHFTDSARAVTNNIVIAGLSPDSAYFFKIAAENSTGRSAFTEVLGGIPGDSTKVENLIVNGFDRIDNTTNTFNLIRQYRVPFLEVGRKFASASNEAIFHGRVNLKNYKNVFWILMDESTADETFNKLEQDTIKSFLDNGGCLFVTGSEIGWDLGRSSSSSSGDIYFYNNYLKAAYVNDAPGGDKATYYTAESYSDGIYSGVSRFSFDNGNHGTIDVDWPDAIKAVNGSKKALKYYEVPEAKGIAGIYFEGLFPNGTKPGKVVYWAFPYEAVYPDSKRTELLRKTLEFFDKGTDVADSHPLVPVDFIVKQNYPNPFGNGIPETTVDFVLPKHGNVRVRIFNVLGQLVYSRFFGALDAGSHKFVWNGRDAFGKRLASGFYIANFEFTYNGGKKLRNIKMALVR